MIIIIKRIHMNLIIIIIIFKLKYNNIIIIINNKWIQ